MKSLPGKRPWHNVAVENIGELWHRAQAERIGRAVAARRKQLGMTGQQLAARCADLGAPIHRTTISKIETGRPRFDLGELVVIAAALHTSPALLMYPGPFGSQEVEVLPGRLTTNFNAVQWLSAIEPICDDVYDGLTDDPLVSELVGLWPDVAGEIADRRELAQLEEERHFLATRDDVDEDDRAQIAFFDRRIRRLRQELGIEPDDG